METLKHFGEEYQSLARTLEAAGLESANDDVEVREIAEAVSEGIRGAKAATGIDVSGAEVKELDGDIAGLYHIDTRRIEADVDEMASGNRGRVLHILTHEAHHSANKENGDDALIDDWRFEEALTEAATAQTTGQIMAYHEYAHMIGVVASVAGVGREELIAMFKNGENGRLNELYNEAYGEDERLAA